MPRRSRAPTTPRFFATAAKGTEALLAEELSEIGAPDVRPARGGVYFGTSTEHAYLACLWSRIALRIHEPLATFPCRDGDDLYDGVRTVDWSRYFGGRQTLAVRAAGETPELSHTHFIAMKTKDAIVDQVREQRGDRPSVDREDPDVLLFVHLARGHATVHVDYSGGSLHGRGFRSREGRAPLRETLAAALVRFAGWTGDTPLLDPMCGSGTLLIEAGLWAARRAPGLTRQSFGFERWSCFDDAERRTLAALRERARDSARPAPRLFGADTDRAALDQARANAAEAGLKLELSNLPIARQSPTGDLGALITNPPYGQRLEAPPELQRDLDGVLRRFHRQTRTLIVPKTFPVTLRASRWTTVYNGPIECELRRYDPAPDAAASGPASAPPAP